jgi:hypothetical protein
LAFTRNDERRDEKRFAITVPVTLICRDRGRCVAKERGRLHDIGIRGASFYAPVPLDVGTHVTLLVEFPNGDGRVTTGKFEGLVTRAQEKPTYETVVLFRRRGKFLRGEMAELVTRFAGEAKHSLEPEDVPGGEW